MGDVVARAVKALEEAQKQIQADDDSYISLATGRAIRDLVGVVPDLVEEIETARTEVRRLRSELIDTESALAASESYLSQEVGENTRLRREMARAQNEGDWA